MPDSPRRGSLLVLFLTVFVDLLGFGIVLPLLPIYGKFFAGGDAGRGWIVGALMASFSAMQFVFMPVWGRLSDRVGRRPVLVVGLAGSVVFYGLFGVASQLGSLLWLFVSRIGAGICGATISTAQAYIADTTPPEQRHKGMALIGAAFGLGFTFGPLFGAAAFRAGDADLTPGHMALPGYLAAGLSAIALLLAIYRLPESLSAASRPREYHWLDWGTLRRAAITPSVGMLLVTSFVCVFSFGNFEATLSVLLKGKIDTPGQQPQPIGPFEFSFRAVCLTYTLIGLILLVVQGGIVRRVAGRVSEGRLAGVGAALEVAGFLLLVLAVETASAPLLYLALGLVVAGFAFMTPSLNSLISRRSDPSLQGGVLGVAQSINSLARILAGLLSLPLIHLSATAPFWLASALMIGGGTLVLLAERRGRDFAAA